MPPRIADIIAKKMMKVKKMIKNGITPLNTPMSNVYINLISTLNLSDIARIQKTTPYCKFIHAKVLKECGCIDRGNQTELEMMDKNIATMNNELHHLASKWYTDL